MKYKTFVMLGKPGAGKGMQSKLLSEELGYPIFSTGGRFREIRDSGSLIGNKIDTVLKTGDLMPSWFAIYLFQEAVLKLGEEDGIIYEGAGRMRPEAVLFDEVMGWLERPYLAVHIQIDDDVSMERLLKRATIENRKDDKEDVIRNRLAVYEREVVPAASFFKEEGKLLEINGNQTPEEVHAELLQKLREIDES